MKRYLPELFLFSLSLSAGGWAADQSTTVDEPQAFTYAQQQLPHQGVLQKTDDGLLYLKVTDRYVYELLPLLPDVLSPPPYFGPGLIGAHITIIHPGEVNWAKPPKIPALGTQFSFTLGHFAWAVPQNIPKAAKVYFLTVESPELVKIRTDAGLSPKFKEHDLHISVGVQYLESATPPLELSKREESKNPVSPSN
jgi:hypothetical protein